MCVAIDNVLWEWNMNDAQWRGRRENMIAVSACSDEHGPCSDNPRHTGVGLRRHLRTDVSWIGWLTFVSPLKSRATSGCCTLVDAVRRKFRNNFSVSVALLDLALMLVHVCKHHQCYMFPSKEKLLLHAGYVLTDLLRYALCNEGLVVVAH
jgi:hypothetical protein